MIPLSCSLILLSALAGAPAPAAPTVPGPPTDVVPDPTAGEEFAHTYDATPEAARAALDAVLEKLGLSLEATPDGELVTGWKWFTREDFGRNVAEPPAQLTVLYPFFQPKQLSEGYYRVFARFEADGAGARVTLVADLAAAGFNRSSYEHQWLQRRSNGNIEDYLQRHLEDRLKQPDRTP